MRTIYDPTADEFVSGEFSELDLAQINAMGGYEADAHNLPAGTRIRVGCGYSTVLPDMDFETYSEAGFVFRTDTRKWVSLAGKGKKGGLPVTGSVVYAQHPSTEVLSLAYNLKDGRGRQMWIPGCPPPLDLLEYIAAGKPIEAFNVAFEYYIWRYVCQRKYGWPEIRIPQLHDAMAKSRAFALPGALAKVAEVTDAPIKKNADGGRLLKKFSVPRNPTKKDDRLRIRPETDFEEGPKLYQYNFDDIDSEAAVSALCPDIEGEEREFWECTMAMNARGVSVDSESVEACISILEQAQRKYNVELVSLTGGAVTEASQVQALGDWLRESFGLHIHALDEDNIGKLLAQPLAPPARRALEIRQLIGSAGVKKIYAMQRQRAEGDRLHELYVYHGARTGRDTGRDVQPTNLVKAGADLRWCEDMTCQKPYARNLSACPWCSASADFSREAEWSWEAADAALDVMKTRDLATVEHFFGDAVKTISGCIRGLLVAGPGKDLICSDYSAIEAVITAVLAGCTWRIETFSRGDDIYLASASSITGTSVEEYKAYKEQNGAKHPDRQAIGKPAELGLGFGGWVNAWRQFDDSNRYTDEEVKRLIIKWREASSEIVEMWGGQVRGKPWAPDRFELYGFEGAAIAAVQNPGQCFQAHGVTFGVRDDKLFLQLPSGRFLTYHRPRLRPSDRWENQVSLSYEGWNSNPKNGPLGWIEINTYGGRLAENIIQATARDILRFAVINLEKAGYPVVMRTYDEIISEVPKNYGTVAEFEMIMQTLPQWAAGWPIFATGGWRGERYRKD